jgi:hypothetical protein
MLLLLIKKLFLLIKQFGSLVQTLLDITFTDNSAFSIVDADIEKVICAIPITTHQVGTASSIGYATNQGCAFSLSNTQTIYAAIEAEATANMATADDLHMRLTIEKD